MSDEPAREWLRYAIENLRLGRMALEGEMLNPRLQNAQQATEKALKAVWVGTGRPVRKTHCIADLVEDLRSVSLDPGLSDPECDLIDAIYMPSKYPVFSALPTGMPTLQAATECLEVAERTCAWASRRIELPR